MKKIILILIVGAAGYIHYQNKQFESDCLDKGFTYESGKCVIASGTIKLDK